jgi:hypothetical protein
LQSQLELSSPTPWRPKRRNVKLVGVTGCITERMYLDKSGLLIDEITIDDHAVSTKPWTQVRRYRYRPDLHLQEYVCYENNRDGN